MKRSAIAAVTVIGISIAVLFFTIGKDFTRCRALKPRHAREREAMRDEMKRIRRDFESQRPQTLAEVQRLLGGLPPKDCGDRGGPGDPSYVARWDIPVSGQSVRVAVKLSGCENDAKLIAYLEEPIPEEKKWVDDCAP